MRALPIFGLLAFAAVVTACQRDAVTPDLDAPTPQFSAGAGCPEGFDLAIAAYGDRTDRNGDGLICQKVVIVCEGDGGDGEPTCRFVKIILIDNNAPDEKDVGSTCPEGFGFALAAEAPEADRNGDGQICRKDTADGVVYVDNAGS